MALFPTPEDSESKHIFRWRQFAATCIMVIGGTQLVQSTLIWGLVPFIFTGFASTAQVNDLRVQQTAIRADQIVRNINDAVERQCYAQREGNMQALQFATDALDRALREYQQVINMIPRIPRCDEVIVDSRLR